MALSYMGGKQRISKQLSSFFNDKIISEQLYIEPFCGSCSVLEKITSTNNRWANDINPYIVALLKATANGWKAPIELTREEYYEIKKNPNNYPPELVGYASIGCSFGSKVWGGYANNANKISKRNKNRETFNALNKSKPLLQNVKWTSLSYDILDVPQNSFVYCDPPYKNTTKYNNYNYFNGEAFWDWVRTISTHSAVYVSEYNAPDDFECVFEIEIKCILKKDNNSDSRIERIFKMR